MWGIDTWLGTLGPTGAIAVAALGVALVSLLRRRPTAPSSQPRDTLRQLERMEEALRRLQTETETLKRHLDELEERQRDHLQRLALVRFRAFPEVGADLSFSLALLDARGNGVVVTSLFGRDDTRVYAKPVREGKSPYRLAPEEEQALNQALTSPPGPLGPA